MIILTFDCSPIKITEYNQETKKEHAMNYDEVSKILEDNNLAASIDSHAFSKDKLLESPPTWRELSMSDFSDEEYDNVNIILEKISDVYIEAPNGAIGKFGDLCGQDYINKQVSNILKSARPCGLIWFMKFIKTDKSISSLN